MVLAIGKQRGPNVLVFVVVFVCCLGRYISHLAARRNISSWSSANW